MLRSTLKPYITLRRCQKRRYTTNPVDPSLTNEHSSDPLRDDRLSVLTAFILLAIGSTTSYYYFTTTSQGRRIEHRAEGYIDKLEDSILSTLPPYTGTVSSHYPKGETKTILEKAERELDRDSLAADSLHRRGLSQIEAADNKLSKKLHDLNQEVKGWLDLTTTEPSSVPSDFKDKTKSAVESIKADHHRETAVARDTLEATKQAIEARIKSNKELIERMRRAREKVAQLEGKTLNLAEAKKVSVTVVEELQQESNGGLLGRDGPPKSSQHLV